MLLCLDVGNSQIYCGVYDGDRLTVQFRRTSTVRSSSDELGVFLRGALRENGVSPDGITQIAICSVVPDVLYSLRSCCQKYFGLEPLIMRPGIKTGLEFLGGNIVPGVRLAMDALEEKTAQLPSVEIFPVTSAIGRSTVESIQNGLYWSNVGMIKELVARVTEEAFPDDAPVVIATGGFATLFDGLGLFDAIVSDLILIGLREAVRLNA
jgi:type III pantothenate kinase